MQRIDIIKALAEFMKNSNIDTDSELYQRVDAALLALMTGNIEESDE